jgi:group I intron endonuclease
MPTALVVRPRRRLGDVEQTNGSGMPASEPFGSTSAEGHEPMDLEKNLPRTAEQDRRKKPCCLYIGTCLINGKMYAGVSVRPGVRWKSHCAIATNSRYVKDRRKLHHAIAKHGIENFTFEIMGWWATEDEAYEAEQDVIAGFDLTRVGYNETLGGEGFNLTPEQCKAIGVKSGAARRGKKQSPEHCAAKSRGMKGLKRTPEQCAALGARLRGKKRPHAGAAISAAKKGKKQTPEAKAIRMAAIRTANAARRALIPGGQEKYEANQARLRAYLERKALGTVSRSASATAAWARPEVSAQKSAAIRAAKAARRALIPGAQEKYEARKQQNEDYFRRKALGLLKPNNFNKNRQPKQKNS